MLHLMSVRQSQEIVPILVNQVKFLRQGPLEEELDLGWNIVFHKNLGYICLNIVCTFKISKSNISA